MTGALASFAFSCARADDNTALADARRLRTCTASRRSPLCPDPPPRRSLLVPSRRLVSHFFGGTRPQVAFLINEAGAQGIAKKINSAKGMPQGLAKRLKEAAGNKMVRAVKLGTDANCA